MTGGRLADLPSSLVRELAEALGGPVTIETAEGELVAFSPHIGVIDPLRQLSILTQQAVPGELGMDVQQWLAHHPVGTGTAITEVPGNEELGILPRVAVPVVEDGVLRGMVWVLLGHGVAWPGVAPRADALLADLAGRIGAPSLRPSATDELLERALDPTESVRRAAARRLVEVAGWPDGAGATVLVVRPAPRWDVDLSLAVQYGIRVADLTMGLRPALGIARGDEALLVVPTAEALHAALGGTLADAWLRALPSADRPHVRIGLATWRPALSDLRTARDQGRVAAELGDEDEPLQRWDRLGVLVLAGNVAPDVASSLVSPRVHRLVAHDPDGVLRHTAETYLDLAGRGTEAAGRLRLHRTTLYYRLQRIEELTGMEMRDGQDRLELHLGLKLLHLLEHTMS